MHSLRHAHQRAGRYTTLPDATEPMYERVLAAVDHSEITERGLTQHGHARSCPVARYG
jgi:hypothetical protein